MLPCEIFNWCQTVQFCHLLNTSLHHWQFIADYFAPGSQKPTSNLSKPLHRLSSKYSTVHFRLLPPIHPQIPFLHLVYYLSSHLYSFLFSLLISSSLVQSISLRVSQSLHFSLSSILAHLSSHLSAPVSLRSSPPAPYPFYGNVCWIGYFYASYLTSHVLNS